jgi:hypothetical protein
MCSACTSVDRRTQLKSAGAAGAALAAAGEVGAASRGGPPPKSYRRIATKEAFATPGQLAALAGGPRLTGRACCGALSPIRRARAALFHGNAERIFKLSMPAARTGG